ncbi:hypothetical protein PFISCL1PPCAC_11946, partial [Pristionchus fissidentatus]
SIVQFLTYVGASTNVEIENDITTPTVSSDWCASLNMHDFEYCPAAAKHNQYLMQKMDYYNINEHSALVPYMFKVFQVRFNQTVYIHLYVEIAMEVAKEEALHKIRKEQNRNDENALDCQNFHNRAEWPLDL